MLSDRVAREKIRHELDKNFLVEAGAGSGKTTSMVGRMLELIREGKTSFSHIAAITFTKKAAAELSQRFQTALEKAYKEEADEVKKERFKKALGELENSHIGTIHSFCGRLLRERPVEAGVDPSFTELEEVDERVLKEKAWEEFIAHTQINEPQELIELAKAGISPQDAKNIFVDLTEYPDVDFEVDVVKKPDFSKARKALLDFIVQAKHALPENGHVDGDDDLQATIRRLIKCIQVYNLEDDRQMYKLLSLCESNKKIVQKKWATSQLAKDTKSDFDLLKEDVIMPALQAWREYCYPLIMDFSRKAARFYDDCRIKSGKLNFQDLLMLSAKLLRGNQEVRQYFQRIFTHLLVDEFQDTDPIQAEVLLYLTGKNIDEHDWQKLVPIPGSLFVVGDPKQSIYRFRRADIATYSLVRSIIEESGGEVLQLTANFRSTNAIGTWLNTALQAILPEKSNDYQAALARVETQADEYAGAWGGVFAIDIDKQSNDNKQAIAESDAHTIAAWVRQALDTKVCIGGKTIKPSDVLVLLKYKSEIPTYARAFENYDIPYEIAGGGALGSSRELRGLLVLLQAVAERDNPVLFVAALRGFLFGVSDQLLFQWRNEGGSFNAFSPYPEGISKETLDAMQPAWESLKKYHEWSQMFPPSLAIEKIVQDTGLLPHAMTGETPKSGAGYILFVLEYLRAIERAEITSFTKAVEYFSNIMEQGVEEEINLDGDTSSGVRLMNLHKAKGLEAPIVFLANPGRNISHDPEHYISRKQGKPCGYLQILRKNGYRTEVIAQPKNWNVYMELERKYLKAEEDRLVYVALTRPKNALIISRYPSKPAKSPWCKVDEYLKDCPRIGMENQPEYLKAQVACSKIDSSQLGLMQTIVADKIKQAAVPTHTITSVTAMTKGTNSPSFWHDTAKGMSWGRVIHKTLQKYGEDSTIDLKRFITSVLVEEERSTDEVDEVIGVIRNVAQSTYWKRAMASQERYFEIPFGLKVESVTCGEKDIVIQGVIDLVFWENDGWVIVDYKTDHYQSEEQKEQLVDYYQAQIERYGEHWTKLTGRRVKEVALLFTESLNSVGKHKN